MGMILVMAFLDMLGVASILPFMAALEQTVDCFVASLLAMTCFDFETSSRATQSRGDPARSAFNVRRGNLQRRRRTSIAALWLYPLKNSRSLPRFS